jgi:hypothetical protein
VGGTAWRRFLVAGLIAAALGTIASFFAGPSILGVVIQIVGWTAIAVPLVTMRSWSRQERLPWYCFAAAGALFLLAGLTRALHSAISGVDHPFPSIADALYIPGYLALITGEIRLIRFRTITVERDHMIDSAMVAAGVGVLAWAVLLAPYVRDTSISLDERALNVVYGALTLAVLTFTARLATTSSPARSRSSSPPIFWRRSSRPASAPASSCRRSRP